MKINVLSAIVLLLVVSSCSTSKTAYFENLDIEEMSGKMDVGNYELRIAPRRYAIDNGFVGCSRCGRTL